MNPEFYIYARYHYIVKFNFCLKTQNESDKPYLLLETIHIIGKGDAGPSIFGPTCVV